MIAQDWTAAEPAATSKEAFMEEDLFPLRKSKKSGASIALGIVGVSLGAAAVAVSIVALALAAARR